jgi:hypothetical protein
MSEVERQLSLPSLYDYRLAIGYCRVVKGGGGNYRVFPSEFGVVVFHAISYFSTRSLLWFSWPLGRKTAASIPRAAVQTPGM